MAAMVPPPLPLPLLLLLLVVAGVRLAGAEAEDAGLEAKGVAANGMAGLTGLPAGLSTLLKFRSSLPPRPLSAASAASAASTPTTTSLDPNHFVKPPVFPEEETWPGSCRLRSKRYVSDGLCVSPRPINEVVCAVSCVMNAWSKGGTRPVPWRCTDSGWKRQRVKLLCRDGSTRSYRVRAVQTCRCVPRARTAATSAPGNQLD